MAMYVTDLPDKATTTADVTKCPELLADVLADPRCAEDHPYLEPRIPKAVVRTVSAARWRLTLRAGARKLAAMAAKTKKRAPTKTSKTAKPSAKAVPKRKQAAPKARGKAIARKQPASAKPASDFAFFGQGDASYFEWFEMWIWFRDPVPKSTQSKLVKIAPKLCALDAQWPHPNLLWASTGDQWIQQHLIKEYGTKDAKKALQRILKHQEESGDPWDTGDEDEDAALAGGKEVKQFNTDIETWLLAMNKLQPILFAARGEDGESGGTRLGAWHKKSVGAFEAAVRPSLEQLVGEPKKTKREMRPSPISIVIGYVGDAKVTPGLAAWANKDADSDAE